MRNKCVLLFHEGPANTDTLREHAKFENIPSKDKSACNTCLSECSYIYIKLFSLLPLSYKQYSIQTCSVLLPNKLFLLAF